MLPYTITVMGQTEVLMNYMAAAQAQNNDVDSHHGVRIFVIGVSSLGTSEPDRE